MKNNIPKIILVFVLGAVIIVAVSLGMRSLLYSEGLMTMSSTIVTALVTSVVITTLLMFRRKQRE